MAKMELPRKAMQWMLGDDPGSVLNLGASPKLVRILLATKPKVIAIDPNPAKIAKLKHRFAAAVADDRLLLMSGHVEALPLRPQVADLILVNSALSHGSDHGKAALQTAAGQLARTLRPGGYLTGMQLVRDDSVPWVRRLITVMRTVDENAMQGGFDDPQIAALRDNKYFPEQDEKEFRVWVPVGLAELEEMVRAQRFFQRQQQQVQEDLIAATKQIYHNAASADQLRLPFLARCWRAYVHQNELTTPISFDGDALRIWLT